MSNKVILIVDDEQNYLDTIAETLKEKDFKIVQAFNGKMGCVLAKKFMPDIIIVDWEMPEMNGIEMIEALKEDTLTKDIPVIMCTGIMTSSKNLDRALQAGAVDYIRKPVEPIELTARINSALNMANALKEVKNRNEQIELQKQSIELKNKELLEINTTKDKLFSIIAHDLRGPIGGLQSIIELLISDYNLSDTSKLKEILVIMKKSSNATYELLENLLLWAKSQRNEIIFNPEKIELSKLIEMLLDLCNELIQNKQIKIVVNNFENIFVYADNNMLMTVLRNLISNAIKFTPSEKSIFIFAETNDYESIITVKDEGVGIKAEDVSKLFNNSIHFSTNGTNREKGSGLGLLLCKEFVEKHGSKIWVKSEVGKGSEFKFTLPLCKD